MDEGGTISGIQPELSPNGASMPETAQGWR